MGVLKAEVDAFRCTVGRSSQAVATSASRLLQGCSQ